MVMMRVVVAAAESSSSSASASVLLRHTVRVRWYYDYGTRRHNHNRYPGSRLSAAATTRRSSSASSSLAYHSNSGSAASSSFLRLDDTVKQALQQTNQHKNNSSSNQQQQQQIVIALESTIVSHGMPYPHNYDLAVEVEDSLRNTTNVVPATIAIRNGVPCIGLSRDELHDLALAGQEGRATKCSTRELPLFMAKQQQLYRSKGTDDNDSSPATPVQWGATTVASTMRLAHLAGIRIMVTGGIGGVHRHGESTMDVSADLQELSTTPLIVVCAGIKSILDIPRTLEVLETLQVPTCSWQSDDFPAFFSQTSGCKSPARVDTAEQVAKAFQIQQEQLRLHSGMLVAVPPPLPPPPPLDGSGCEEDGELVVDMEIAIQQALQEAVEKNIQGKDVTPYLLQRVSEVTGGQSLQRNMALYRHNATVGAAIAKAMADMKRKTDEYYCSNNNGI